jgi:small subunit ribosomal protein S6
VSNAAPTYDLVLMLDLAASDEERAKIVADTRATIEAEGELLLEQDWGARSLTYEIDHREQAEYHLMQLHGPTTLISSLERTLRIADGVVRHRIIKLAPGTPAAPEQGRAAAPVEAPRSAPTPAPEPVAEAAPAEAVAEAEPEAVAEATPAEPVAEVETAEPVADAAPEAVAEPDGVDDDALASA